ncbi:MAG: hypothetical protein GXO77_17720 [Calditrichaeota bacterium]|nr:hypothetical protein [Calditrichota bacterium]
MAEHDLLNEDDFFEKLKKEKRATEQPEKEEKPAEPQQEQEPLETDLFEKQEFQLEEEKEEQIEQEPEFDLDSKPEEEEKVEKEEEVESFHEEQREQDFFKTLGEPESEPESFDDKPEKYVFPEEFEDEKLPGINFKPIIIGVVVFIVLAALLYVLRGVFFGGKEEESVSAKEKVSEQPVSQPAPPNPLEVKKTEYLNTLAGKNFYNLNLVKKIEGAVRANNAQISSVLFYVDELSFEIFSKNRAQLAAITMQLRDVLGSEKATLVATDERPGDGITGIFTVKLKGGAEKVTVTQKLSDLSSFQQWLEALGTQFNIKMISFKEFSNSPDQFGLQKRRVQFKGKGSYDDCLKFLSAIAASNRNLNVHKMIISATDQKTFNKAKYQIELVVDLFI